jgi:hypothetical protein
VALRLSALLLSIGLCWAGPVLAQSTEPSLAAKPISPETIALSADFEGQLDRSVNTAYFCKGIANFVAAPTTGNPDNQALLLTLDPSKSSSIGRCEAPNARTERAELAEPDDVRLPLGTEIWYGFRFMVPAAMKGKFAGQRLVLAQLKQHPDTCPLHDEPFGLSAASEGNPTVSFRLIEDDFGDVIGLQLAVSSDDVRKISVGQLMRHRGPFLDRWHDVLLHVKVVPHGVEPPPAEVGFVEGWLDGQPFMKGRYGMVDETGAPDVAEPFGYAGLVGCTYFKYGIYRDSQAEPWTIGFDHFRRGATRQSVESPTD